jgi:hypothetical protein
MSNQKFTNINANSQYGSVSRRGNEIVTTDHLRNTKQREENLQRYARSLAGDYSIKVKLSDSARTASIRNFNAETDGDTIIVIPTYENEKAKVNNPFPDVDEETFYAMLQYAEVVHECAHYLHSDEPTHTEKLEELQEKLESYPRQLQGFLFKLGKDLWNAIEDAAIEEAMRKSKSGKIAHRLDVKNKTFIAQQVNEYDEQRRQNTSFDFALHMSATDLGKYDTGALRRILDGEDNSWDFATEKDEDLFFELYELIQEAMLEAYTTPDPILRTNKIFDYIEEMIDVVIEDINADDDMHNRSTSEDMRRQLQQNQTDDAENETGKAQQNHSEGLEKNDEDEVAKQQAQTSGQTVVINKQPDADQENNTRQQSQQNQQGQQNQQSQQGQQNQQGQQSSSGSGSEDNESNQQTGSDEAGGAGGSNGENDDVVPACPDCGGDDTERKVQTVDGMVAARVNAPFNPTAKWVDSVTFVNNKEVCGFRVTVSGTVPQEEIEQQGYKVIDVGGEVEILEPRDRYDESEKVHGFECNTCGHVWVPKIGGD